MERTNNKKQNNAYKYNTETKKIQIEPRLYSCIDVANPFK
jgi:hypothetical protein